MHQTTMSAMFVNNVCHFQTVQTRIIGFQGVNRLVGHLGQLVNKIPSFLHEGRLSSFIGFITLGDSHQEKNEFPAVRRGGLTNG
jgi:hypothetical protein